LSDGAEDRETSRSEHTDIPRDPGASSYSNSASLDQGVTNGSASADSDTRDEAAEGEFQIDSSADDAELEALLTGKLPPAQLPPGSEGKPPPLSKERIKEALAAEDWTFNVDSDGDIGGLWDSNVFYFFTYGEENEILQIRGRWHQDLPIELRSQVREVMDEWHYTKIWPKAYTTVDDSGRVWVLAEHSVDWEHGVTDAQLRLTMRCAITTSLSLFQRLEDRFVTVAPKDEEPPADWS
jgi:hypothetical protein